MARNSKAVKVEWEMKRGAADVGRWYEHADMAKLMTANNLRRLPLLSMVGEGLPVRSRWGRMEVTPIDAAQMMRELNATIYVYPPGTTASTRRLLGIRGTLTSWTGLILAALTWVAAGGLWGGAGLIAVLVCEGTAWVGVMALTRHLRKGVRSVSVRGVPRGLVGPVQLFESVARQLDELDGDADLDPVRYELRWGHIYDQLGRGIGSLDS